MCDTLVNDGRHTVRTSLHRFTQPIHEFAGFHHRIKWRHDSILEVIEQAVLAQIAHEQSEREKQARVEKAAAHVNPLLTTRDRDEIR